MGCGKSGFFGACRLRRRAFQGFRFFSYETGMPVSYEKKPLRAITIPHEEELNNVQYFKECII